MYCLSWSWSYGSWIYNYLCNQYVSPLMWVRIPLRRGVLDTTLCDKVGQRLAAGWWFSKDTLVSSSNKTDCHAMTESLLKVALNTINQPWHKVIRIKVLQLNICGFLEWVSDYYLTPSEQFYRGQHGENKLLFDEMMMCFFMLEQHAELYFYYAHWDNSACSNTCLSTLTHYLWS